MCIRDSPEIGRLIAEAMEKVTSDGVITIEENKTTAETYNEIVEGKMCIRDRSYTLLCMKQYSKEQSMSIWEAFGMGCLLYTSRKKNEEPDARHRRRSFGYRDLKIILQNQSEVRNQGFPWKIPCL